MQPSEFDAMDYEEAVDIATRVWEMHQKDVELDMEVRTEHTKVLLKALGASIRA